MAWENITHSCGHEARHQLYGKRADRERKAAWLTKQLCTDCWNAEQEAKRAEENARAQEQAQAAGLPELTGSPKQIAWATSIRQKAFDVLKKKAKSGAAERAAALVTKAAWWIDKRYYLDDVVSVYKALKEADPQGIAQIEADYK